MDNVRGDCCAEVREVAGAPSEGYCGVVGTSKNMTSQGSGKIGISTLLNLALSANAPPSWRVHALCPGGGDWERVIRHSLQFFINNGSSSRHTFSVITFSPAAFG